MRDGPRAAVAPSAAGVAPGERARIEDAARDPEYGISDEHGPQRRHLRDAERGQKFRSCRTERAQCGRQRADQAVAREHAGAVGIGNRVRECGMLQRHEDADAARAGVDGAEKCDEQDGAVGARAGEGHARRRHQSGRGHQQLAPVPGGAEQADPQRHERRAQQRQGGNDADLQRPETDRRQVDGQQNGDEAIAEIPQGARGVDVPDGARIAGRREA